MLNIPDSEHPRVVILGAGFAGFTLAKQLRNKNFQVILIDRNNYHQFQPLFYQVAMAGLEPSSIIFPLRKAFQNCKNVLIRITEVDSIDSEKKRIYTPAGDIYYDKLVIASGATTNFFGNEKIKEHAFTLKSISESLHIRNEILSDLEKAVMIDDYEERQGYIDIVIVGGGPTGVELAGALIEMKNYILPKDYRELNNKEVDIYLIQGGDRLLPGMSEKAGKKSMDFLKKMGVDVMLNKRVIDYDGKHVLIKGGEKIKANKVIWAAGIKGQFPGGIHEDYLERGSRIKTNHLHEVEGLSDVYALGDVSIMKTADKPYGDPQVAQVAIQHAKNLAHNLVKSKSKSFVYNDYGSMATVGRNKAVADVGKMKMAGFFAWIIWLFIHLMALIGFKNKVFVMINWLWNYITYDQSLRVIIRRSIDKD